MATKITEPLSEKLPSDLLEAIGRVATEWADLELNLDCVVGILIGFHDVEAIFCVTAQNVNSARKLDALLSLAVLRKCPDNLLKKLRSFAGRTGEMQRMRNRIIHDPWMATASGDRYRLQITAEKTLTIEHKKIPTQEVRDFAAKVKRHTNEFRQIAGVLINTWPVSALIADAFRGKGV